MVKYKIGTGYISSNGIEVTTSQNQEIIKQAPENWSHGYKLYKFSIKNDQPCNCTINGKFQVYLRANQGFSTNEVDLPIRSFVIHEVGVHYNFIGAY